MVKTEVVEINSNSQSHFEDKIIVRSIDFCSPLSSLSLASSLFDIKRHTLWYLASFFASYLIIYVFGCYVRFEEESLRG